MKTVCVSMWKGDAGRHLARRAQHLLAKQGVDEWVWVIRQTADMTPDILREESEGKPVTLAEESWPAPNDRMLRLSVAADFGVAIAVARGADRILWHESDLFSPPDVVSLLARTSAAVVGGWPVLPGEETPEELRLFSGCSVFKSEQFYDTWGYRAGGERFTNDAPYSPHARTDEPFKLDSVGSVALIDAGIIRRGARFLPGAFINFCQWVHALDGEVWCDPRVKIVQPLELWTFNND